MTARQETLVGDTGPFSEYLSESELAQLLPGKPKQRTLRHWRTLGEGPQITRVGQKVFYHLDDVKKWLRSRHVEGA